MEERDPGRTISVWMHQSTIDRADQLSAKADLSRSKFLGQIVDVVMNELALCNKVGLVQFSRLLADFQEHLKVWTNACFEEPELKEMAGKPPVEGRDFTKMPQQHSKKGKKRRR